MSIISTVLTLLGRVHRDSDPVIELLIEGKVTYISSDLHAPKIHGTDPGGRAVTNAIFESLAMRAERIVEKITTEECDSEAGQDILISEAMRESAEFANIYEQQFNHVKIDGKYSCFQQLAFIGIVQLISMVPESNGVPHIKVYEK